MYVFKNAIKNLGRNKGRNILIGVIILAIITAAAVALIINNTAGGIIDDYKMRFGAEVNIRLNENKLKALRQNNPTAPVGIPSELYLQFADSEYLK